MPPDTTSTATFKPRDVEELIDFYFHRRLANAVVRVLAPLPITPNQVTVASAVVALIEVETWLAAAGALEPAAELVRSRVRFSTVGDALAVHSAYPTTAADAVFFGPDSYRFVALLRRVLRPARRVVDVGAGSGFGGLAVADRAERVALADVNAAALRLARVNAAIAGVAAEIVHSDVLAGVDGAIDAVIANPPYLVDGAGRLNRDGGRALGFDLALRIAREAIARLSSGGQVVLYTGSPVIDGVHPLRERLAALGPFRWEELDPDVFGEELDGPAYARVERIAVVAATLDVA